MHHSRRDRHGFIAGLGLTCYVFGWTAYAVDVISINLQGNTGDANQTLASGDAAGVITTGNWNNVAWNGTVSNLRDATGAATTADLAMGGSSPAAYTDFAPTDASTPNHKLLNGGCNTGNNAAYYITATITDLPAAFTSNGYDIYVYTFSDGHYGTWQGSDLVQIDIGNNGSIEASDTVKYNYTTVQSNFDGTLTLATGGSIGEYVKFTGVGAGVSSFQIKASVAAGSRAWMNGIQIVSAPPSASPTVTINATDATASEQGPDAGSVSIQRTGVTGAGLTVNYAVSGTASNGVDYTPTLSGTCLIPAGTNAATVTVMPVDDSEIEGTDRVTLTILPGAGYEVGAVSNGTIQIMDNDGPNTISINVTGLSTPPYTLSSTESAGVIPVTRWNPLNVQSADIELHGLVMYQGGSGVVTTASLLLDELYDGMATYSDDEEPGEDGNAQLLGGGALSVNGAAADTVHFELSFTNLPPAITAGGYDLYVYGFLDGRFVTYRGTQRIELDLGRDGSIDASETQKYHYIAGESNFDGNLTQATGGSIGEYVKFAGVGCGVDSFKLRFSNPTLGERVVVNGVQIVAIRPVPRGTSFLVR